MDLSLIIPAFIAGVLTFLAPCTLPLVPGYLAFISGEDPSILQDNTKLVRIRGKIFLNGVLYVIGFSVVFIVLGTLAGFVGTSVLGKSRILFARIGGLFVIMFGLFMLDVIKLPVLTGNKYIKRPAFLKKGTPSSSLFLGSAFAFGWTPCVGPILGSVLLLATTSTTVLQGTVLLTVFSAGLGIPFLVIAYCIGAAYKSISRVGKYMGIISKVGGIFLLILGALLFTDNMSLLVSFGYRYFNFLNYDALLDYL